MQKGHMQKGHMLKQSRVLRNRRIVQRKTILKQNSKTGASPSQIQQFVSDDHDPSHVSVRAALAFTYLFRHKDLDAMPPQERAAIRIQRQWRITERLRQGRYRRKQVHTRVNSIIVYILFLMAHFYSTIWPLSEGDNYHFVNNLKGQLADVEFNTIDSPTWGKSFTDIATMQETNQWLRGPFQ